ncbi:hypothetical protein ABPG75_006708 [Micractinium tetrahymenae]
MIGAVEKSREQPLLLCCSRLAGTARKREVRACLQRLLIPLQQARRHGGLVPLAVGLQLAMVPARTAATWLQGLLLLLAVLAGPVCAQSPPASGDDSGNGSGDDRLRCSSFFHELKPALQACDRALDQSDSCPPECQPVFTKMPKACMIFISSWLPASLNGSLSSDVRDGEKAFNLCDLITCPPNATVASDCSVPVSLLRTLDLYRLEALASQWAIEQSKQGSGSSFNGVKVAVIVAGVVAGNILIVAAVAGFVYLRKRRRKRRRLIEAQCGQELAAAPGTARGRAGTGAGCGGSDDGKLEQRAGGDLDSAENGRMGGKPGAAYDIAAATAVAAEALRRASLAQAAAAAAAAAGGRSSTESGGSSLLIVAGQPPRTPDVGSAQGVAALWAAATQGAVAWQRSASAQGHSSLSPTLSSSAATAEHLQPDEQEMMLMGSSGALVARGGTSRGPHSPGARARALAEDPLLSWVSSHMQQPGGSGGASPAHGSGPPPSLPSLPSRRGSGEAALASAAAAAAAAAVAVGAAPMPQPPFMVADSGFGTAAAAAAAAAPGALSAAPSRARSSSSRRLDSGLVDLTPWLISYGDLDIQRPLGEGSFGRVLLAKWRETLVAAKVLLTAGDAATAAAAAAASSSDSSAVSLSSPTIEALQKEAGLMAALRHPNVVQFIGVCISPPAVVTEFCSRGSLLDVLRLARASEQAAAALTWVRRLSMALDAAKGMLYLHAHSPPVIHRDLKSPNLLVDSAWRVKVADFNLSKLMEASSSVSSTGGAMNPRWLAPEILVGQQATATSDVFSFGVVLHELLTWELPWGGANLYQLVFIVSHGERLPIPPPDQLPGPDKLPAAEYRALASLIRRCWAQRPEDRPAFADVIVELRGILSRSLAATSGAVGAAAAADAATQA